MKTHGFDKFIYLVEFRRVAFNVGRNGADFGERCENSGETERRWKVATRPATTEESHETEKAAFGIEEDKVERRIERGTEEDSKEKRAGLSTAIPKLLRARFIPR